MDEGAKAAEQLMLLQGILEHGRLRFTLRHVIMIANNKYAFTRHYVCFRRQLNLLCASISFCLSAPAGL